LQEVLRLTGPQSLPGGQSDVAATTPEVLLQESHGDDGSPFLVLQSATSLNELFERAQVHGVNLSDYPTGLFLTKSVLKKTHPEQWELREMGIFSSSSGQIPSPGSWEYFEHLVLHDRRRSFDWNVQSYCDHYAYELFICAYITGAILTQCPMAPLFDRKRCDVLRLAHMDHQNPQWGAMHRALWRIWSFCRIFGSGKGRECDLQGQKAWLEGCATDGSNKCALRRTSFQSEVLDNPPESFGWGNQGGLSIDELKDMMFFWRCLQRLLRDRVERDSLPEFLCIGQGTSFVEKNKTGWTVTDHGIDSLLALGLAATHLLLSPHDSHPLVIAYKLRWTTSPVIPNESSSFAFLLYPCRERLRELHYMVETSI
jgi:hypothetical protein